MAFQSGAINSFQEWMRRVERGVDHGVDRFAEAGFVEAHVQREFAKEIDVGFAFADRSDRLN